MLACRRMPRFNWFLFFIKWYCVGFWRTCRLCVRNPVSTKFSNSAKDRWEWNWDSRSLLFQIMVGFKLPIANARSAFSTWLDRWRSTVLSRQLMLTVFGSVCPVVCQRKLSGQKMGKQENKFVFCQRLAMRAGSAIFFDVAMPWNGSRRVGRLKMKWKWSVIPGA